MIRAIKVGKCRECEYFGIAKEGYEYTCKKTGKIVEPGTIPDSCPLPPWPSVTDKEIEDLRGSLITHWWPKKKESLIKFLKSIGVIIKEVRDED